MKRRELLILGISTLGVHGCAPGLVTGPGKSPIGIPVVPAYESLFIATGSSSLLGASAAGENDSVASRIKKAFADSLDSVSSELATKLIDQFSRRGMVAQVVPYAQANSNLVMSYSHVALTSVLECTPIYQFGRDRQTTFAILVKQVDTRSNAEWRTMFMFGSVAFLAGAGRKILGNAISSEDDWYPLPGNTASMKEKIVSRLPAIAEAIVAHYTTV